METSEHYVSTTTKKVHNVVKFNKKIWGERERERERVFLSKLLPLNIISYCMPPPNNIRFPHLSR